MRDAHLRNQDPRRYRIEHVERPVYNGRPIERRGTLAGLVVLCDLLKVVEPPPNYVSTTARLFLVAIPISYGRGRGEVKRAIWLPWTIL